MADFGTSPSRHPTSCPACPRLSPASGPPSVSTSHGGGSTRFQSWQSLAMDAVSAAIKLSSGECQQYWAFHDIVADLFSSGRWLQSKESPMANSVATNLRL